MSGLYSKKNLGEVQLNLKDGLQKLYETGIQEDLRLFAFANSIFSEVRSGVTRTNADTGQAEVIDNEIRGLVNKPFTNESGVVVKRTKFVTNQFTFSSGNLVYFDKIDISGFDQRQQFRDTTLGEAASTGDAVNQIKLGQGPDVEVGDRLIANNGDVFYVLEDATKNTSFSISTAPGGAEITGDALAAVLPTLDTDAIVRKTGAEGAPLILSENGSIVAATVTGAGGGYEVERTDRPGSFEADTTYKILTVGSFDWVSIGGPTEANAAVGVSFTSSANVSGQDNAKSGTAVRSLDTSTAKSVDVNVIGERSGSSNAVLRVRILNGKLSRTDLIEVVDGGSGYFSDEPLKIVEQCRLNRFGQQETPQLQKCKNYSEFQDRLVHRSFKYTIPTSTWSFDGSASASGIYGFISINPYTGEWTYTLDNDLTTTQALGDTALGEAASTGDAANQIKLGQGPNVEVGDRLIANNDEVFYVLDNATANTSFSISTTPGGTEITGDDLVAVLPTLDTGAKVRKTGTESFIARVTDENGANDEQTINVTIEGTDDVPVVTSNVSDASGTVIEDSGHVSIVNGIVSVSGTLSSSPNDIDYTTAVLGYEGELSSSNYFYQTRDAGEDGFSLYDPITQKDLYLGETYDQQFDIPTTVTSPSLLMRRFDTITSLNLLNLDSLSAAARISDYVNNVFSVGENLASQLRSYTERVESIRDSFKTLLQNNTRQRLVTDEKNTLGTQYNIFEGRNFDSTFRLIFRDPDGVIDKTENGNPVVNFSMLNEMDIEDEIETPEISGVVYHAPGIWIKTGADPVTGTPLYKRAFSTDDKPFSSSKGHLVLSPILYKKSSGNYATGGFEEAEEEGDNKYSISTAYLTSGGTFVQGFSSNIGTIVQNLSASPRNGGFVYHRTLEPKPLTTDVGAVMAYPLFDYLDSSNTIREPYILTVQGIEEDIEPNQP